MEIDFIIDQVSWHTQKERNYEIDNELIRQYFVEIIKYLQTNSLTTRIILSDFSKVDDNTCIRSSDLTIEGMELMKKAYGRWVDGVMDKGKSISDFRVLDKALNKIRSQ